MVTLVIVWALLSGGYTITEEDHPSQTCRQVAKMLEETDARDTPEKIVVAAGCYVRHRRQGSGA